MKFFDKKSPKNFIVKDISWTKQPSTAKRETLNVSAETDFEIASLCSQ
jgi:hypothetical protein